MRFWDTSGIVPLLLQESATGATLALYRDDPELLVWWGTAVECASAVSRREREGQLDARGARAVLDRLDALRARWHEVLPVEPIRTRARRLLRVHRLRAADAFQLAAALLACEGEPSALPLVTLDERLADAASREGFRVLPSP